jgi:hypothetical protein
MILGALLVGTVLLLRLMRQEHDEIRRDWNEYDYQQWLESRRKW